MLPEKIYKHPMEGQENRKTFQGKHLEWGREVLKKRPYSDMI